jgi:hypothetical protein
MPLTLPAPVVIPTSAPDAAMITGPRSTTFRFELLGRKLDDNGNMLTEAMFGLLDGVEGGSVSWETWSAIKGAGSIILTDTGQDIDWLTTRIRPIVRVEEVGGTGVVETACGVFVPSTPIAEWTSTGRKWTVELLDKNSLLDQDIITDEYGNPLCHGVAAGANVIDAVKWIIAGIGESSQAIEPSDVTLGNGMVWDMGTTRLKIINDLLDAANFASLWCDGWGNYRTQPFVDVENRQPIYTLAAPFIEGKTSVFDQAWTNDKDIYGVPNRMVAIGEGTEEVEAPVAVVENTDPASPFSYQNRGRWITVVDTGVAAVDETALLGYAKRRMTNLTLVSSDVKIRHLYLPSLLVDNVVRFTAGDVDRLCVVRKTEIVFNATALCATELREVRWA